MTEIGVATVKTVLVVDDSLTIRKAIVEIIDEQADFQVIGEACEGQQACEMVQRLRPDVITMDMMMPQMNGLEATRYIMAHCPTPILIISASTNRGELMKTYDALSAGAVSVVEKPGARSIDDDNWERNLLAELRLVAKILVVRHHGGSKDISKDASKSDNNSQRQMTLPETKRVYTHVVIGGSTGGPRALNQLLAALPSHFSLPITGVIHINQAFSTSLGQWLDKNTPLEVVTPAQGSRCARPGQFFLAPGGSHLVMYHNSLSLSDEAPRNFCRPSVDVLFESAAQVHGAGLIGVLLTGMGNDGAQGLKAIKAAGGYVITQSEDSCVVYGMPHEADLLCDVDKHLSPAEIAAHLLALSP